MSEIVKRKQQTAVLITKLKNVVKAKENNIFWLDDLSDNQLLEIYQRVLQDQPLIKIIEIVQKKWGIQPNVSTKKLIPELIVLKNKMLRPVDLKHKEKKEIRKSKKFEELFKKNDSYDKFDGMKVLAWTIKQQAERLLLWRKKEKEKGEPSSKAETTIKELGVLLDKYIKLQVELGITGKGSSDFNNKTKHTFEFILKDMVSNDGKAMVNATNKLMKLIEEEAIDLKEDKNGTFKLLPEKKENNENRN